MKTILITLSLVIATLSLYSQEVNQNIKSWFVKFTNSSNCGCSYFNENGKDTTYYEIIWDKINKKDADYIINSLRKVVEAENYDLKSFYQDLSDIDIYYCKYDCSIENIQINYFSKNLAIFWTITKSAANFEKSYVVINKVKWATKNVGATTPRDLGNYYTWEQAQNICPNGWRLPTKEELDKLLNEKGKWTSIGSAGRFFGSGDNILFLVAAGKSFSITKEISDKWDMGYYWSSTPYTEDRGYALYIGKNNNKSENIIGWSSKEAEFSVRCIMK